MRPTYRRNAGWSSSASGASVRRCSPTGHRQSLAAFFDRRLHHVHGRTADEAGDEQVHGLVVEFLGRRYLLQRALAHHRHTVAHGHGLDLVVGHVDRGHSELVLQAADLGTHLHAELGVQIGERLVHEKGLRLAHDGAPHGDALALATGEGARLAIQEVLQTEHLRRVPHTLVDLVLGHLAQAQPEGDVVVHLHVRVERVVLEHHGDVAVARRHVVDDRVADGDRARGDGLEPGEHAQRRRLAAARRPHEHDEFAIGDHEVHVRHGLRAVGEYLGHPAEGHFSHVCPPERDKPTDATLRPGALVTCVPCRDNRQTVAAVATTGTSRAPGRD